MENTFYVLGSLDDPAMGRIEKILRENECHVGLAYKNGRPVNRKNAYLADGYSGSVLPNSNFVLIECKVKGVKSFEAIDCQRCYSSDHSGPEHYWEESSLGQVYARLGIGEPLQADRVLAAMSYDLNAALQGKCPGVDKMEVLDYKTSEIALATSFPKSKVHEEMEKYCSLMDSVPSTELGRQSVLKIPHVGLVYSLSFLAS